MGTPGIPVTGGGAQALLLGLMLLLAGAGLLLGGRRLGRRYV